MTQVKKAQFFLIILIFSIPVLNRGTAQPMPGDVFREYYWYNQSGDAGQALRVGGSAGYGENNIKLRHDFDLDYAVRAEVIIEKILCHDGTRGLSISINDNEWMEISEADSIPYPQWDYQHHTYPVSEIPLSWLKQETGNVFKMKVSTNHPWGWPQNLINGVHFRIYYDAAVKPHPAGETSVTQSDDNVGNIVTLQADVTSPDSTIKKIDFIGLYEDVNFEGDGIYYQWHYHYYHGMIRHHIGTATGTPYQVNWDTSWIPDQHQPIKITARIVDESGMIYMTDTDTSFKLNRSTVSVELCKPYNISRQWVTRKFGKQETFTISGDVSKATATQLVWSSWSPGYMNGIYINGIKVFDKEGPLYQYYAHRVSVDSTGFFKQGNNILKTGQTPTYNGETVHGMEVNWPGIMVLIRYENVTPASVDDQSGDGSHTPGSVKVETWPNPFNSTATVSYTLFEPAEVQLHIYSLSGQVVRTLVDSYQGAGIQKVYWDGADNHGITVGAGIYLCSLYAGDQISTRKIVFVR